MGWDVVQEVEAYILFQDVTDETLFLKLRLTNYLHITGVLYAVFR